MVLKQNELPIQKDIKTKGIEMSQFWETNNEDEQAETEVEEGEAGADNLKEEINFI